MLAGCCGRGVGLPKDLPRTRRLSAQALRLDPLAPPAIVEEAPAVAAALLAALAAGVLVWGLRRRL
jgi:hypothetical protein